MAKVLLEHYSGDMDAYNTPVLVVVDDADLVPFLKFLDACDGARDWSDLRQAGWPMYEKYILVRDALNEELFNIWPEDAFTLADYDHKFTRPAKLYRHRII